MGSLLAEAAGTKRVKRYAKSGLSIKQMEYEQVRLTSLMEIGQFYLRSWRRRWVAASIMSPRRSMPDSV